MRSIQAPAANATIGRPPALDAHTSVLFSLPEGNYAHVLVRDNLNAPNFMIGDALLANLTVTSWKWDGTYVVQIGDQQLVRWVQWMPDPTDCRKGAFRVFCVSMPDAGFYVSREQLVVLASIEAHAQVRRVG